MNISFFIARRYLLSRKSTHAINIISMISVAGIFIGTASLIIILSVFNGFKGIALSMYNSFSPDLKIETRVGKTFDPANAGLSRLQKIKGIHYIIPCLEEKALLVYHNRQYIATLRGLDSNFQNLHTLDTMMIDGRFRLQENELEFAVLGAGIQYRLGVQTKAMDAISVYSPGRHSGAGNGVSGDFSRLFNRLELYPEGVFSIQEDYDDQYVLTSLRFMRKLLNEPREVSSLEIYTTNAYHSPEQIQTIENNIASVLPPKFTVKDRFQQNELLFKTLNSEKWAVFLILAFVLLIAIFNVMGSLTMLVIEKQQDISILGSMGASRKSIRSIFLFQGLLISLSGGIGGLIAGWIFCLAQQKFGFIKIGAGKSFVVDSYPVVLNRSDFIFVIITVLSISFIASWLASGQAVKKNTTLATALTGD